VYLFQRTPSWVFDIPNYLAEYPPQVNWLDRNVPYLTNFVRFRQNWLRRPTAVRGVNDIDPDFHDPLAVSAANKAVRDQRLAFMRSKFGDNLELIATMTPPAPPGATRPVLVDPTYCVYDVLLRDDVTLVSTGIDRITSGGIATRDGAEYDIDVIVLATGFRANDFLWPMEVRGRDGRDIQDLWSRDGARAYLGTMLPGFPNFFMIYGPNTNANVGFAITHMQELVTRFALECIGALVTTGTRTVDVTPDAYWRYNDALDQAAAGRIYDDPRVHSYFRNKFGRCATNAAFDGRLMWNWLRNPADPGHDAERLEERFLQTSQVIHPYFGRDLILA
jgi:4-hydroxyacetophenone monooxygenase